jgi:hypothetical protein
VLSRIAAATFRVGGCAHHSGSRPRRRRPPQTMTCHCSTTRWQNIRPRLYILWILALPQLQPGCAVRQDIASSFCQSGNCTLGAHWSHQQVRMRSAQPRVHAYISGPSEELCCGHGLGISLHTRYICGHRVKARFTAGSRVLNFRQVASHPRTGHPKQVLRGSGTAKR